MFSICRNCCIKYGGTESHPENVSDVKPFINKYKWNGIKYSSKIDYRKTLVINNSTAALNVLYIKDICLAYISKVNSNCEKQIILSMIPNEEKEGWHFLAVEKLSALLHGITYWFLLFDILLEQKMNVNLIKNYVKLKGFYGIVMTSEKNNILGFNQYTKSDKMPYIVYADIESLIKKKEMDVQTIRKIRRQ